MKRAVTVVMAVAVIIAESVFSLGWVIARRLTAPDSSRRFDLIVRDVESDGDHKLIVLDRTRQTTARGIYNLWFAGGGWAQLSEEALNRGRTLIARTVTNASSGFSPSRGQRASWSGIYFASPADAGLISRDVTIDTPVGSTPAWLVEGKGDRSTWAIHIHGMGSSRAGTLRGVQTAACMGYTSLVVSYRNDAEGPRAGKGRSTLGFKEAEDAEAAMGYAIKHGARRIVLFGWSMGAAIVLQLASRARDRDIIAGLVLESPVLDWVSTIKANCVRSGLPAVSGSLAVPWLTLQPLARITGLPTKVPLRDLDWVARAAELPVPILIIHGNDDDSVPIRVSEALRELRPDLVELEAFNSGHSMTWNSNPERWRSIVTAWLSTNINTGEG